MAEGSGAMPRLLCTIHSYAVIPKLGGSDITAIHTVSRRYQSEADRFVRLPGPAVIPCRWSPASRPVTTPLFIWLHYRAWRFVLSRQSCTKTPLRQRAGLRPSTRLFRDVQERLGSGPFFTFIRLCQQQGGTHLAATHTRNSRRYQAVEEGRTRPFPSLRGTDAPCRRRRRQRRVRRCDPGRGRHLSWLLTLRRSRLTED